MTNSRKTVLAAAAAAALCVPVAAQAKGNGQADGHGHGLGAVKAPKQKTTNVIVKGTVTAVEGDVVTVDVKRANHHGHALVNQPVQLDVSAARLQVKDANHDGSRDLADVAVGDRVLAQLRVPRGAALDLTQAFTARRLLDVGPAPAPAPEPAPEG